MRSSKQTIPLSERPTLTVDGGLQNARDRALARLIYEAVRLGWITSIPGDTEVTMECLPDSTLPTELRKAGYDVREIEDGERILHSAVTEHFTLTSSGAFEPLSPNSTKTIAETVRHAGIVKVRRFAFEIP